MITDLIIIFFYLTTLHKLERKVYDSDHIKRHRVNLSQMYAWIVFIIKYKIYLAMRGCLLFIEIMEIDFVISNERRQKVWSFYSQPGGHSDLIQIWWKIHIVK